MPSFAFSGGAATNGFNMGLWNPGFIFAMFSDPSGVGQVSSTEFYVVTSTSEFYATGSFSNLDANNFPQSGTIQTLDYATNSIGGIVTMSITGLSIPVASFRSWALSNNIEAFRAALFDGNDTMTGGVFDETIYGYGGVDTIDGGEGVDAMYGGEGDDFYIVDNSADVAFEGNNAWGTDTVFASASYALGGGIDNLILTGSDNINGTGNGLANVITGNSGANSLTGGAGDDTFVFGPNSGDDIIVDFVAGGTDDELDLSAYTTAGITWTITQVGADTVFDFANGDSITLLNTTATSLVQLDPDSYG